jgi:hypothetical protein
MGSSTVFLFFLRLPLVSCYAERGESVKASVPTAESKILLSTGAERVKNYFFSRLLVLLFRTLSSETLEGRRQVLNFGSHAQ